VQRRALKWARPGSLNIHRGGEKMKRKFKEGDIVEIKGKIGTIERLVGDPGLWEIKFFDGQIENVEEDRMSWASPNKQVDVTICPGCGKKLRKEFSENIFRCENGDLLKLMFDENNSGLVGWIDQESRRYAAKLLERK